MKSIEQGLTEYIAMKRAMGFSFQDHERHLKDFCSFLKAKNKKFIAVEIAKEWALGEDKKPTWWHSKKLSQLRSFALYWKTMEPKTELWPEGIWPIRYQRKNPYIYRDEEIQLLLRSCRILKPEESIRPLTFEMLFGLIASCGLRLSEAVNLKKVDVDLQNGLISVKKTKFYKPRIVPLHRTTLQKMAEYAKARDNFCNQYLSGHNPSEMFFISNDDRVITTGVAEWTFNKVALSCGVRSESRRGPRLHDLRHTFVVRSLEDWYRQGKNIEILLPILSTYVGHVQPSSTYWYISSTPELMGMASEKLDKYMKESFP